MKFQQINLGAFLLKTLNTYNGEKMRLVVKFTNMSNMSNMLQTALEQISFRQKITNPSCKCIKASKTLFYEKPTYKKMIN